MQLTDLKASLGLEKIKEATEKFTVPLIVLCVFQLHNSCQVSEVKSEVKKAIGAYTKAPVLVQLAPTGEPIVAKRVSEGYLTELNVLAFVKEVVAPLYLYDANLPVELGGGPDPGIKVPELRDSVPTLQWVASQAFIAPESRVEWLKEHIKGRPDGWEQGNRSFLMNISATVKPSENGDDYRVVSVVATKVVTTKDGALVQRGPWSRDVEVQASLIVKPLLKPTALEKALSLATRRGLFILSIRPPGKS